MSDDIIHSINVIDNKIDICPITRKPSNRIIGYGIWLSQGNPDDPTEYFIPEFELDLYIEKLQEVKQIIQKHKVDNE